MTYIAARCFFVSSYTIRAIFFLGRLPLAVSCLPSHIRMTYVFYFLLSAARGFVFLFLMFLG